MSASAAAASFPRLQLLAVATVLGGALLCCTAARIVNYAATSAPAAAPIATINLTFTDLPNGAVGVHNAATGQLVDTITARNDGFLRTTLRVLAGQRARNHIGAQKPFRLTQFPGGRVELTDTATGQQVELEAFGPSNIAEFLRLIPNAETKS